MKRSTKSLTLSDFGSMISRPHRDELARLSHWLSSGPEYPQNILYLRSMPDQRISLFYFPNFESGWLYPLRQFYLSRYRCGFNNDRGGSQHSIAYGDIWIATR